jgi:hypothetical protein
MSSIFRTEIRCNLGILQVSAQYGDEVPTNRVHSLYFVQIIYEKVKRKDEPKSGRSVHTAMVEVFCSVYEQELKDWMLLLTACISIAELKHKTKSCKNNNLFVTH